MEGLTDKRGGGQNKGEVKTEIWLRREFDWPDGCMMERRGEVIITEV